MLDTGSREDILGVLDCNATEAPLVLTVRQKAWEEEFGMNRVELWASMQGRLHKM